MVTNNRLVAELATANATLGVAVIDIVALQIQINNLGDNRTGRGIGRGRGAGEAGRRRGGVGQQGQYACTITKIIVSPMVMILQKITQV